MRESLWKKTERSHSKNSTFDQFWAGKEASSSFFSLLQVVVSLFSKNRTSSQTSIDELTFSFFSSSCLPPSRNLQRSYWSLESHRQFYFSFRIPASLHVRHQRSGNESSGRVFRIGKNLRIIWRYVVGSLFYREGGMAQKRNVVLLIFVPVWKFLKHRHWFLEKLLFSAWHKH